MSISLKGNRKYEKLDMLLKYMNEECLEGTKSGYLERIVETFLNIKG